MERDRHLRCKRVTDIMAEITAASQEQSSGIEQVNQAITQMDQVTQQNAALVGEASAAAESLKEQSGRLAQAVAVFRVGDNEQGPGSASAPSWMGEVRRAAPMTSSPKRERKSVGFLKPAAATGIVGSEEWQEF